MISRFFGSEQLQATAKELLLALAYFTACIALSLALSCLVKYFILIGIWVEGLMRYGFTGAELAVRSARLKSLSESFFGELAVHSLWGWSVFFVLGWGRLFGSGWPHEHR